jgi:hypothetical protein
MLDNLPKVHMGETAKLGFEGRQTGLVTWLCTTTLPPGKQWMNVSSPGSRTRQSISAAIGKKALQTMKKRRRKRREEEDNEEKEKREEEEK